MKFSEKELDALKAAVARVEERTAAEIVPYVVRSSGTYAVAVWRGTVAGVAVALASCMIAFLFYSGWSLAWLYTGWGTALAVLVLGLAGALVSAAIPSVKRAFAGAERLARTVHLRAMQAFVEEEVFATQDRTGILLFISVFEHRIEIIADTAVNERVREEDWGDIVARIREGIRSGQLYEGLVEAFEMCGALLEEKGVELKPDDVNELSDEIRMRRERRGR